jgi:hypothetical protein
MHSSVRKRIMQGSKNIDILRFLIKPSYNEIDISDFKVVLTYILPVSKERKTLTLTKSEGLYKERLEYKIPINNENFTSEVGDVKMWITIMQDNDIVRYITPTILTIYPAEETNIDPSKPTQTPTVDNLHFDKDTNQIYLTSNGTAVGASISIKELTDAIVDTSNDGLVTMIT